MDWNSLATRYQKWQAETKEAVETARYGPGREVAGLSYASMAVSPTSFSQQLGELQISLQRANTAQGSAAEVEMVPVQLRRSA